MEVKTLKKQFPIENKSQKLLLGDAAFVREIITGWDEMLKRLDQSWEVVEELDDDRFLMKRAYSSKPRPNRYNSSRAKDLMKEKAEASV